jgi:hypothetical protein
LASPNYFDEHDEMLQPAVVDGQNGAAALVTAIDHGLAHSTHLLAVLGRPTARIAAGCR